ncbi:RagB/SusD family nutrient uptake outer membrane protein [Paradesertivirga mongoliensis]|uniref:RagB/SusD family nutrient uptake outer membrane protein n=1 Tax=Paradesertivirga mongoliensis TaxID=2100740 RepID=A0ABW4ZPF9_9SPHI|nr:RagB/SusD family nutrient uptake outer membrane protein [Pedobacter mongoliensis]
MKIYSNNILKKAILAVTIACSVSACKVNDDEFFELPDRGGIDAASLFDAEGSVQLHINRVYDNVIPQFIYQDNVSSTMSGRYGIHLASDENIFPAADQWARTALGLQSALINHDVRFAGNTYNHASGGNKYFDIAKCNAAIKYIPGGKMSDAKKKEFLGQYHALRAMTYFELAKVYGGVPLTLEPIDPQNINVKGRASARQIFDVVLSDINKSIEYLEGVQWQDANGRGKIDKLIATCIKAEVLMYWASPQFNPGNDESRWITARDANKVAYELAYNTHGKRLLPNYADIFRLEGTENTEAILVRTYSSTLERRGHDGEYRARPASAQGGAHQGFQASTRLLDAYPMKDGNPIGSTASAYTYDPVMFWQNRDPRFEATIAYNGSTWPLDGDLNRKQWTYNTAINESNLRGVYSKRFTSIAPPTSVRYQSNLGGNGMDWIEIRLAEVMLNYAECANETGDLATAKDMVREIRKRAKIEQGTGTNDYGLGSITSEGQMRDLILNERMIEFAFENKRNSDLRRTRRMHLLTGNMETIEVLLRNGNTTKNILEAKDANGVMFRDKININDKATYLQYFQQARVISPGNYQPYNIPEFHYFYTFHNDFVNSGIDIQPTIGWAGGTFDPLAD